MKKTLIIIFSVLLLTSISLLCVFLSFKNSYKYVIYQTQISLKAKDIRGCDYFDFGKIIENGAQRTIKQNINLDLALNREHDYEADALALQMMNDLKDSMIIQQKLICESQFENYNKQDTYSKFEIFWNVFTNYKYSKNTKMNVEKISKTKYDIEFCNKQKDEDCNTKVYEKINNKWYIVELY